MNAGIFVVLFVSVFEPNIWRRDIIMHSFVFVKYMCSQTCLKQPAKGVTKTVWLAQVTAYSR